MRGIEREKLGEGRVEGESTSRLHLSRSCGDVAFLFLLGESERVLQIHLKSSSLSRVPTAAQELCRPRERNRGKEEWTRNGGMSQICTDFIHRIFGVYAPWDPGNPATCDFWPELTKLVQSTTTSWTLRGNLNGSPSLIDHPTNTTARAQFTAFLAQTNGHDICGIGTTIFPAFDAVLNKARIKYPNRSEKHRHEDFRTEMDRQMDGTGLKDIEFIDDSSFLNVYDSFTAILIPTAEKAYGHKLVAELRFTGGTIRTIRDDNPPLMSHGAQLVYTRLVLKYYDGHPDGVGPATKLSRQRAGLLMLVTGAANTDGVSGVQSARAQAGMLVLKFKKFDPVENGGEVEINVEVKTEKMEGKGVWNFMELKG
ncbi:hypothetical protein FB451DRAFT_1193593 [Mycena latifolia]|nr:hypothetical protein FB451DRAFT_1193593 [Mycena latifolia]